MRKLKTTLFIIIFIFLFIFIILRFNEDTWICENGQWVKHGVPNSPMPESQCSWSDNFNPFK